MDDLYSYLKIVRVLFHLAQTEYLSVIWVNRQEQTVRKLDDSKRTKRRRTAEEAMAGIMAMPISPSAGHIRKYTCYKCRGFETWLSLLFARHPTHPDSQMPVYILLPSPHMSFNNCQHQQCFVVSCSYRKPQAYKSAGLIVRPQVYLYANTLIYSRGEMKPQLIYFTYSLFPLKANWPAGWEVIHHIYWV